MISIVVGISPLVNKDGRSFGVEYVFINRDKFCVPVVEALTGTSFHELRNRGVWEQTRLRAGSPFACEVTKIVALECLQWKSKGSKFHYNGETWVEPRGLPTWWDKDKYEVVSRS